MKKNQVNEKFVDAIKVKKMTFSISCIIFVIFILALSFALIYIKKNENYYINYEEKSFIDYNVFLKENDYFEQNYLTAENQYIASLIDYISTNFNYEISFAEQEVDFTYSYRIEAEVLVKEISNDKNIFNNTEKLIEKKDIVSNNKSKVIINEKININYNEYNEKIKNFINLYKLDEINSILSIKMYVSVIGSCDEIEEYNNNESVMVMNIPLNTKTVDIDISNNLLNSKNNVIVCNEKNEFTALFLIFSLFLVIVDIILVIVLIKYVENKRSANSRYERELKKILYNYHSYIQETNNIFDLSDYKMIGIKTFNDLLEIRDTESKPILMISNKEKKVTYFIIPTNSYILYVYKLQVSENNNKNNKL